MTGRPFTEQSPPTFAPLHQSLYYTTSMYHFGTGMQTPTKRGVVFHAPPSPPASPPRGLWDPRHELGVVDPDRGVVRCLGKKTSDIRTPRCNYDGPKSGLDFARIDDYLLKLSLKSPAQVTLGDLDGLLALTVCINHGRRRAESISLSRPGLQALLEAAIMHYEVTAPTQNPATLSQNNFMSSSQKPQQQVQTQPPPQYVQHLQKVDYFLDKQMQQTQQAQQAQQLTDSLQQRIDAVFKELQELRKTSELDRGRLNRLEPENRRLVAEAQDHAKQRLADENAMALLKQEQKRATEESEAYIRRLDQELLTLTQKGETTRRDMAHLEDEKTQLQNTLAAKDDTIEFLNQKISLLQVNEKAAQRQKDELESKLQTSRHELEQANDTITMRNEELLTLTQQRAAADRDVARLEDENSKLRETTTVEDDALAAKDDTIASLNQKVSLLQVSECTARQQQSELQSNLQTYKSKLEQATATIIARDEIIKAAKTKALRRETSSQQTADMFRGLEDKLERYDKQRVAALEQQKETQRSMEDSVKELLAANDESQRQLREARGQIAQNNNSNNNNNDNDNKEKRKPRKGLFSRFRS